MSKANSNQVESFLQLRADGVSFQKISDVLGVSKQTLIAWAFKHETEISNLKAIKLEALRERYKLQCENRIEPLCARLKKLQSEIEKRNFSELKTQELLQMEKDLLAELKALSSANIRLAQPEFDIGPIIKEIEL